MFMVLRADTHTGKLSVPYAHRLKLPLVQLAHWRNSAVFFAVARLVFFGTASTLARLSSLLRCGPTGLPLKQLGWPSLRQLGACESVGDGQGCRSSGLVIVVRPAGMCATRTGWQSRLELWHGDASRLKSEQ
jgi:hypothetical protein